MRGRKCPLSLYKGKWQQAFSEHQAMENLKRKVMEEPASGVNFLALLMSSFHIYESKPNFSAYSFIIEKLSERSLFSHLAPILEHLEKVEKFETPERIFTNLIKTYGAANMLDEAVDIFLRIPNFRCSPSVYSLNTLLSVLCKKKEGLILVQDVLLRTQEMNVRLETSSFWILIRALCRNGKVDYAIELLNLMQIHECMPDSKMYSLILSSLCKNSCSTRVRNFFEEMQNTGFRPSMMDYTNVISVLVKEEKVGDAYTLLNQMKHNDVKPDIVTYTSILNGLISSGDFQKGEKMFDEILGDFAQACKMLISMDKMGCRPDVMTYNIFVGTYCKAGEVGEARGIINKMQEKGIHPNLLTYRILFNGLLNKDEIIEAHKILKEMLSKGFVPQLSGFGFLICGLCEQGFLFEALEVLEEMVARSLAPESRAWRTLLLGFKSSQMDTSTELEGILKQIGS